MAIFNVNITLPQAGPSGPHSQTPTRSGPAISFASPQLDVSTLNLHSPSPATSRSSSHDSPGPAQIVKITYPSIREAVTVLSNPANSLIGQVEKIYCALEKIGIFTVDQICMVDNHYLETKVGIPPFLISSFREECRREEIISEGYGASAMRE